MKSLNPEMIWWQGVVEDTLDPKKLGRLKIRIQGYHTDDINLIPTEDLPWAPVIQPIISAANSGVGLSPTGILNGSWVIGFFLDGPDMQRPIVFGTVAAIPEDKAVPKKGFFDPFGEYPLEPLESDINRLIRNEQSKQPPSVTTKKNNREKDIVSGFNEKWSEPETKYDPNYPTNHVKYTESGHIEEFDDTTDKERINREHKTGTFQEWHPDGSEVKKIVGSGYEIVAVDKNVLIKGKCNITVNGDANILIKGDKVEEVKGNSFLKIGGTYNINVKKDITMIGKNIHLNP